MQTVHEFPPTYHVSARGNVRGCDLPSEDAQTFLQPGRRWSHRGPTYLLTSCDRGLLLWRDTVKITWYMKYIYSILGRHISYICFYITCQPSTVWTLEKTKYHVPWEWPWSCDSSSACECPWSPSPWWEWGSAESRWVYYVSVLIFLVCMYNLTGVCVVTVLKKQLWDVSIYIMLT